MQYDTYYTPNGSVKVASHLSSHFQRLWETYSRNQRLSFKTAADKYGSSSVLAELSESGEYDLDEAMANLESKRSLSVHTVNSAMGNAPIEDVDVDDRRIEVEDDDEADSDIEDGLLSDKDFYALDSDEYLELED